MARRTRFVGWLALLLALMLLAAAPARPSPEEDQGILAGMLQDLLSGAGREVRIRGFSGALSSRATIQELTIADDQGVWITLHDVVLDWNRAALLDRRVEVNELSAQRITVSRDEHGRPLSAADGLYGSLGILGHHRMQSPGVEGLGVGFEFLETQFIAEVDRRVVHHAPHGGSLRGVGSRAGTDGAEGALGYVHFHQAGMRGGASKHGKCQQVQSKCVSHESLPFW